MKKKNRSEKQNRFEKVVIHFTCTWHYGKQKHAEKGWKWWLCWAMAKKKMFGAEEAILDVGLINFAIIHNVE